jgi:hypothetical protein
MAVRTRDCTVVGLGSGLAVQGIVLGPGDRLFDEGKARAVVAAYSVMVIGPAPNSEVAAIGIDIGKNSFHIVGQDRRGALVLRQKWSRGQVEARLANLPPCLIGMEACVGAHHHIEIGRPIRTSG